MFVAQFVDWFVSRTSGEIGILENFDGGLGLGPE